MILFNMMEKGITDTVKKYELRNRDMLNTWQHKNITYIHSSVYKTMSVWLNLPNGIKLAQTLCM